jgi:hypothetical protein
VVPQRIILISSTAHSDSNKIFKTLKNLDWDNDVIEDYNDDLLFMKMDELKMIWTILKITSYIEKLGKTLYNVKT